MTAPNGAAALRDVNVPFLKMGDIAFAARIPKDTLSSWFDRGQVLLVPEDQDTTGPGDHRLMCLRTAYKIAIIADLYRLGLPVRKGAIIAAKFADHGNPGREPGRLFGGYAPTFLLAHGTADTADCCPHAPLEPPGLPASLIYDCKYALTAIHAGLGLAADPPGYVYPPEAEDE